MFRDIKARIAARSFAGTDGSELWSSVQFERRLTCLLSNIRSATMVGAESGPLLCSPEPEETLGVQA
jgi:hypothetical protein